MTKSFHKTLIAASVGAIVLAAAGTASANSLLFPYFTTNSGAQSVLSISSTANAGAPETLHYVYNYGSACTHYDGSGSVTANDLMQHSIAAPAAGGFGKAVGSDGSTPFYFPLANTTGFLVVSNKTTAAASISGDMAIADPSTGLVVSYPGTSNYADTTGAQEGNFSTATGLAFNLSFYPTSLVATSWYGVVLGNMNDAISHNRNWTGIATVSNQGVVYDNDEKPFSGAASKTITCGGSVLPADLMTSAQQAVVGPSGGLIHAATTFPAPAIAADQGIGLVLSKLQVVQPAAGAPFAGKMFLHNEAPQ